MNFTTNCTRVPIHPGTILDGKPVESGLAPASLGLDSDPVSINDIYDSVTSNPSGRVAPDCEDERPAKTILICSKPTIISTFNVRTLGPKGRLE